MNSANCYTRTNRGSRTFTTIDVNSDSTHLASNFRYSLINKNRRYFPKLACSAPRRNCSMKGSNDRGSKMFSTLSEIYSAPSKAVHKIRVRAGKPQPLESTTVDSFKNFHKRHRANHSLLQSQKGRLFETSDNSDYFQKITLTRFHNKTRSRQYQLHTTQLIPRTNSSNRELSIASLNDGKSAMKAKDFESALTHFDEAFRLHPKNAEALVCKGLVLVELEKSSEAVKTLEQIGLLKLSLSKAGHLLLASAYKKLGRMEAAISALNAGLKIDKDFHEARVYRASLYIASQKWAEAKSDLAVVLKSLPKNLTALLGVAECEEGLKNYGSALEAYKKAIEVKADLPSNVHARKARIELKLKDYNHALESIDLALKLDRDRVSLYLLKGIVLEKRKQVGEAALHYEQAAKAPDFQLAAKALFKLAKMKLREKDYYEAHFNIRRAVEKNSAAHKVKAYKTLIDGIISLMKGKTKTGMQHLLALEGEVKVLKPDVKFIYYLFKAYGHMAKKNFEVIRCFMNVEWADCIHQS